MPVVLGVIVTCPEVGSGDLVTCLEVGSGDLVTLPGVSTKTGVGYPCTFMEEYGFENIPQGRGAPMCRKVQASEGSTLMGA